MCTASPLRGVLVVLELKRLPSCHSIRPKDMTRYLKKNAVFVINCSWDKSELEEQLPAKMRKDLAEKEAKVGQKKSWT